MNILKDNYYDAVVISDEVDPNHAGAVRIRIFGITDELKKQEQPFAIPAVVNLSAVPTKGTLLQIVFDDGDINKPKYFNASAEKKYLPQSYVDNYPNVAVANLGGDLFMMFHHRTDKNSLVTHPSQSVILWDNFGTVTHDSEKGYDNAGRGANQQAGKKIHPVLTEATIDPFTCTPVGAGDANQGSEYFQVTHISKQTVDMINGQGNNNVINDKNEFEPSGIDTTVIKQLLNTNGNAVSEVTFMRTQSFIEINSDRKPTHFLIGTNGNEDFQKTAKRILNDNNLSSVHFLVGKNSIPPPAVSEGSEIDKFGGFAQFVELKNDAYGGNDMISTKNPLNRANKNAISIAVISNSTDPNNWSQFQRNTINVIKTHVKQHFKLKDGDITTMSGDNPLTGSLI